ncbi:hypothetical protein [Roseibium sediminis]|uniref:hypothetical protein n=1 Tax=Roseibium sediminis TaxID=1775174 RepID=UPI00123DD15A|nr:hypothetical protein [Roseibium sediminis]
MTPPALTEISSTLLHDCHPQASTEQLVALLQGELTKFRIPFPPRFSGSADGSFIEAALGDGKLVLETGQERLPVDPLLDLVAGLPDPEIFADAGPVLARHVSSTRLTLTLDPDHHWSTETTLAVVSHITAVLAYALPTTAVYWPLSGYVLPTDAFADLAADDNLLFLNTRPQINVVSDGGLQKTAHQVDLVGSEVFIGHRVRFVSADRHPAEMTSACLQYLAACLEQNALVTSADDLEPKAGALTSIDVLQATSEPDGLSVVLLGDGSTEETAEEVASVSLRGSISDIEVESYAADDVTGDMPAPPFSATEPPEIPDSAIEAREEDDRFHAEEDRMTSIAQEPDIETQSIAAGAALPHPAIHSIEEDLADAAYSAADTDFQQMQAPRYGERIPSRAEKPIEPQKSNIAELRAFALASSVREEEAAARRPPVPNGLLGRLKGLIQKRERAS